MQRLVQIFRNPLWWMVAVLIAAYYQVALCHQPMQWDMTDQIFVWRKYIAECFQAHIFPLWCPYSRFGYPIYADPQSGLFYPLAWPFYLFRYTLYSNDLEYLLHLIIAAMGMRFLLRTLGVSSFEAALFGCVYAMSGPFVTNASHLVLIISIAWMPWLLGAYIRFLKEGKWSYILLTALVFYLSASGGYAALNIIMIYIMVGILIYYLISNFSWDKTSVSTLFIKHSALVALTLLLSAAYLYAVITGLPYMDRSTGISRAMANSVPFTPRCLISMIYPNAVGSLYSPHSMYRETDISMEGLYIGLIPLVLLLMSVVFLRNKKAWLLIGGGVFFLLASMGTHTPVRGLMYDYIPLMNIFRHAGILRFFSALCFVILGAQMFDSLFRLGNALLRKTFIGILLAGLVGACCLSILLFIKNDARFDFHSLRPSSIVFTQNIFHLITLFISISVMLLAVFPFRVKQYIIGLVILFDMAVAVQSDINKTVIAPRNLSHLQQNIDKLPKDFPLIKNESLTSRSDWNDSSIAPPLWRNGGTLHKQISFEGYNGFILKNYAAIESRKDFQQKMSTKKTIEAGADTMIKITDFSPHHIVCDITKTTSGSVTFAQMYFPGWQAKVDGKQVKLEEDANHFLSCSVPAGQHQVEFLFDIPLVKWLFLFTVVATIFLTVVIPFFFTKINNET